MRKLVVVVCILFFSLSVQSQKRFEISAKATVEEMKEVISISKKQADNIYDLELKNNIAKSVIRAENTGNQSVIRAKINEIDVAAYKTTREILGAVNMRDWTNYLKEKRKK